VALTPVRMRYHPAMRSSVPAWGIAALSLSLLPGAWSAEQAPATPAGAVASPQVAVLNGNQIVQILDQTVQWYRTLGAQQQSSSQPSDLLIYYANQQTASQVVALAFDIARANAELLSSEASTESSAADNPSAAQASDALQRKLKAQRQAIQAEMTAAAGSTAERQAKHSELQGELDMINARLNLLDNMQQFISESNTKTASVNALKSHIDAIAASIPASPAANQPVTAASPTTPTSTKPGTQTTSPLSSSTSMTAQAGVWELASRVFKLRAKGHTIEAIDRSTAALEDTFRTIRAAPLDRLKTLTTQSDTLTTQADTAHGPALKTIRDQLDTLAWLFQQTSAIWIPMSKEGVLLEQYRHNLRNWHDAVTREYQDALKELGIRVAILIGMLVIVFGGGEVWRRLVIRYILDPRRRHQQLLVQKLTVWTLAVLVIALTFVTEISTFATFAGLITAGLAVAMQSVLLSIVGYFFLIGKFGLRIGDRVQIGAVSGEVISLGLVRMHLMELNSQGPLGATGRVVAFANSIVFQASNGLFRQIAGVDFVWHEAALTLPAGSDYAAIKARLLAALNDVLSENHEELTRQTQQLEKATASTTVIKPVPQVQLRFSPAGVEALVRYPVHLQHEAETDERVSQEILKVVTEHAPQATR
jgi:small-conductance mechanosensitive channel